MFIFIAILDSLQEMKQIPGIVAGKQGTNSLYIPTIYFGTYFQRIYKKLIRKEKS